MLYIPLPVLRVCLDCGKLFHEYQLVKHKGQSDGVDSRCLACHAIKSKMWREAHIEQARQDHRLQQRKYRAKYPDRVRESKHSYYVTHRDQILERDYQYRSQNREEVNKRARLRHRRNGEQRRLIIKRWSDANPEKRRAARKRRQMQKRMLPATFIGQDWIAALDYWHGGCAYCGHGPSLFDQYQKLQQEHHIPASKGGGYTADNIIPACQSCNYSKKDRDPNEWACWKFGPRKTKAILKRIQEYFEWVKRQHE